MTGEMPFSDFFDSYVNNFMLRDVSREIEAARRGEGGGNFLAALGLLTYTEVMGHWVPGVHKGSRNAFEAFFDRLGPCYAKFRASREDPYDFYRNGMVHNYLLKGRGEIAMFDPHGHAPCGVFKDSEGWYGFIVERYFQDFVVACARLYKQREGHRHSLIHMWAPRLFPYAVGGRAVNPDLA